MTGNEDREVVRTHQLADLPGMETGGAGQVVIGAGFARGDGAEGAEDEHLRGRDVEPAGQVMGKGKPPGAAREVSVEPAAGDVARARLDAQLRQRAAGANGPLD